MNYFGEVRVYVGGHYEMTMVDEILVPVWKPGRLLCKARYHNRNERQKIIKKCVETCEESYDGIEVGIIPDTPPEEE